MQIHSFLTTYGWNDSTCHLLSGDASHRVYHRLMRSKNHQTSCTLLLVASPCPTIDRFIAVSEILRDLGFSVPRIVANDSDTGLMLVEDFGDQSFTTLLDHDQGISAQTLYFLAMDVLITLHRCLPETKAQQLDLPHFTSQHFIDELMVFIDVYLEVALKRPPTHDERKDFTKAWWHVVPLAYDVPRSMVLRDFHAANMIYLSHRPGLKACGLIDFQDAGIGPISYDVISLIEDARRTLADSLVTAMIRRYLTAFPLLDHRCFKRSLSILGAVRHTRIIGIFMRLAVVQKRCEYLAYLPRVWQLLERCLTDPDLAPVAAWFDYYLPRSCRYCFERSEDKER